MFDLAFSSITTLSKQLRAGEITVGDVVAASSDLIARLNERFRAYSHLAVVAPATIDDLAAEMRDGRARSPIHGLTASVKGNIPVAGLPFTEGSPIFTDRVAERDAGIVRRLREAGAIVMGTTTLSELAMYGVTNAFEPMGLNPWEPERTAGGSSTGAGVAAALGMAQVNVGTDSGGSLRNPACHCGVVGLMPRIGRLTREGKPNHAPSLSSVGLVGRRVADVAVAFDVLAEPADDDAPSAPARRLLVPRILIEEMCDAATLALFEAALARLAGSGFVLIEQDVEGWIEAERGAGVISLYEGGQALAGMDIARAGEGIRRRAATAGQLAPEAVEAAREAGRTFRGALAQALITADADAFVSPTWPFAAPPIDSETALVQGRIVPLDPHRNCFVRVANAIDACAISLPMGLYPSAGVPAGLHLMASGHERRLLATAMAAEAAMPQLPPPPARESVTATPSAAV